MTRTQCINTIKNHTKIIKKLILAFSIISCVLLSSCNTQNSIWIHAKQGSSLLMQIDSSEQYTLSYDSNEITVKDKDNNRIVSGVFINEDEYDQKKNMLGEELLLTKESTSEYKYAIYKKYKEDDFYPTMFVKIKGVNKYIQLSISKSNKETIEFAKKIKFSKKNN